MTQANHGGCLRLCTGLLQPLGGLGVKTKVISAILDFPKTLRTEPCGVNDMACHQQTELSYAWEKYMDYRLQGADLQVGAAGY